ncbi:hypothetical protein E0H46_30390 [Rhizobium leguminosarum bv. viciae]|nr:hypothetical protein E0H46_30390 [Rhizobium leguminosarum bv. viciae]
MSGAIAEFLQLHLAFIASLCFLVLLFALFFFGVWSRSYVFPADAGQPLRRQFVAALPVGLITMAVYAKSALPTITDSANGPFDMSLIAGYAIVYGMLSRESLDRIMGVWNRPRR